MLYCSNKKRYNLHRIVNTKNYDLIEKMLIFNCDDVLSYPCIIEYIYGISLYYSDQRIISLVNLFVRENNIEINRYEVLKCMYKMRLQKIQNDGYYWSINELNYLELEDNKKKRIRI